MLRRSNRRNSVMEATFTPSTATMRSPFADASLSKALPGADYYELELAAREALTSMLLAQIEEVDNAGVGSFCPAWIRLFWIGAPGKSTPTFTSPPLIMSMLRTFAGPPSHSLWKESRCL